MEGEDTCYTNPNKLSTVEVYGFIGWIITYVSCGTFIDSLICIVILTLWLFLPDAWLARIGVTYIVNREYAITVPIILVLTIVYLIFVSEAFNMIQTKPFSSYYTIKGTIYSHLLQIIDEYSRELNADSVKDAEDKGKIAEIYDIPITTVNKLLYEKSKIGNGNLLERLTPLTMQKTTSFCVNK